MITFDERLIVLGTGIRVVGQLTMESIAYLRRAEQILCVVEDVIALKMFREVNSHAAITDLAQLYAEGKDRRETYRQMIEAVLQSMRNNTLTVLAMYGHPGVMAIPGHEAIRLAKLEGYKARMLPAISAEDCLIADLGIDPLATGCQSFEATDFLLNNRIIDPTCTLILWQVGAIGTIAFHAHRYDLSALPMLIEKLLQHYPPNHPITFYEAAILIGFEARITTVQIKDIVADIVPTRATWVIPPFRGNNQ